ncbi:MAG: Mu transposase C-terminal domain-containing protein, partial [bacterium]
IEAIPRSAVVRTRKGPKYFEENCGYYIDRDWSQCAVNEIWCGDHRQIDVLVYKNDERNSIGAPWISAWMDMRSRCLVGWHISFSPNSDTVALSFRHGILRAGLPETIYIDNGKDYRSYYFSGNYRKFTNIDFDLQTKSIVNRTGTHVIHALPYNHKAKPIESFFKFMALRFDRGHPGWRGPNPKAKPEKLEHEIKRGELLTFNEFKEKMEAWLEWYNTEHVHSETRRIAQSFYETARVKMITETEANFLLMKKKDYKLGRRGVRLHGIDFFSEDLFDRTLPRDVVEIRWDPRDLSEILIFDDDGFVCKAFAQYPVDARGMSEREWAQQKRYKQIQNAHLMRRVEAIQDPYGEKKKRAKRKLATPKPIAKNGLRLITREGILAQQVDDSAQQKPLIEKTLQEQEMEFMKWVEKQPLKKTGTDDNDFGLFDGIEVESGPYGKKNIHKTLN